MNTRFFTSLMIVGAAFSNVAYADWSSYQIQTMLGASEAWRLGPTVVLKWCEQDDPEGHPARSEKFQKWSLTHQDLRNQIENRFNELAPRFPLPGTSGARAIEAARARITIELTKQSFWGKSKDEIVQYCKAYPTSDFPLWSESRLGRAESAITELNRWYVQHPTNTDQSDAH
jgi:hypothetical protein